MANTITPGWAERMPAPQPKTIKVQALVGVTADGEYFVLGRNDADDSTLRFEIEAEVPLPDDAVETVQGKAVSHD